MGVIARSQESKPSLVFNQYADDKDLFLEQQQDSINMVAVVKSASDTTDLNN